MSTKPTLKFAPRSWQSKALEAWKRASNRGVVQVVTGGGKTIFAQMCMLELLNYNPDVRFLILVPTTSLMDQWYVSLVEDLGIEKNNIATWF